MLLLCVDAGVVDVTAAVDLALLATKSELPAAAGALPFADELGPRSRRASTVRSGP